MATKKWLNLSAICVLILQILVHSRFRLHICFLGVIKPQRKPAVQLQSFNPMSRKSAALGTKKGFVRHTKKSMLNPAAAKLTESIDTDLPVIHIILSYNLIDLKRVHTNTLFLSKQRLPYIYFITKAKYIQTILSK